MVTYGDSEKTANGYKNLLMVKTRIDGVSGDHIITINVLNGLDWLWSDGSLIADKMIMKIIVKRNIEIARVQSVSSVGDIRYFKSVTGILFLWKLF